ncbi:Hypothetical predicted protein [Pelobates cultripes]|uniref:Uncharacterized protein n=1 Tax=Pelobates cultripes TaxID=61616 RepID=A0AAD1W215_PELCU|nr:Hypothetical predicted protein [Pelobates cultripes]
MAPEQYSELLEEIQINLEKLERNVIETKKRKYLRDKEDYARDQVRSYTKVQERFTNNTWRNTQNLSKNNYYTKTNQSSIYNSPRNERSRNRSRTKLPHRTVHRSRSLGKTRDDWETVVRRKRVPSPKRYQDRTSRPNIPLIKPYDNRSRTNIRHETTHSHHNRFQSLNIPQNDEDFWPRHMRGHYKETPTYQASPGKRRRSLEEGEVEEAYGYKKERREIPQKRTEFSTSLNEN